MADPLEAPHWPDVTNHPTGVVRDDLAFDLGVIERHNFVEQPVTASPRWASGILDIGVSGMLTFTSFS